MEAPILSSLNVTCVAGRNLDLDQDTNVQFFRTGAHLGLLETVYLSMQVNAARKGKDLHIARADNLKIARTILGRLPSVKRVELDFEPCTCPPLMEFVSMLPSLRVLSMQEMDYPLQATDLVGLIDWLQRGEHHSDKQYL